MNPTETRHRATVYYSEMFGRRPTTPAARQSVDVMRQEFICEAEAASSRFAFLSVVRAMALPTQREAGGETASSQKCYRQPGPTLHGIAKVFQPTRPQWRAGRVCNGPGLGLHGCNIGRQYLASDRIQVVAPDRHTCCLSQVVVEHVFLCLEIDDVRNGPSQMGFRRNCGCTQLYRNGKDSSRESSRDGAKRR